MMSDRSLTYAISDIQSLKYQRIKSSSYNEIEMRILKFIAMFSVPVENFKKYIRAQF